jgi:hypothetical protein
MVRICGWSRRKRGRAYRRDLSFINPYRKS